MTATLTERIPLVQNEQGDMYIEGSRIYLEHLVEWFNEGKSPQDILHDYPTLALADIYAVLTYYLRHQNEVDAYVDRQYQKAKEAEAMAESYKPVGLIKKMKAKQTSS
jgi:uncharacterized protein (DUF433 family)